MNPHFQMTFSDFLALWYGGYSFLPVLLVANTGICFVVSYLIAYGQGHIFPFWPYISDAGAHAPESCYFGQLLNISAMCAIVFGVLRYWMIKAYMERELISTNVNWIMNKLGLILMVLAGFGMSMVANFQESHVSQLHFIGAAMTFGLGGFYVLTESFNSYTLRPVFSSRRVPLIRTLLGVSSLLVIGISVGASMVASTQWEDAMRTPSHSQYEWQKGDPGYIWHVISTGCEWASGTFFLLFFVTMIPEFRCFSLDVNIQLNHSLLNVNISEQEN